MNHEKAIVTVSMLWLGFLIFASRDWAQRARDFVRRSSGDVPAHPERAQ